MHCSYTSGNQPNKTCSGHPAYSTYACSHHVLNLCKFHARKLIVHRSGQGTACRFSGPSLKRSFRTLFESAASQGCARTLFESAASQGCASTRLHYTNAKIRVLDRVLTHQSRHCKIRHNCVRVVSSVWSLLPTVVLGFYLGC